MLRGRQCNEKTDQDIKSGRLQLGTNQHIARTAPGQRKDTTNQDTARTHPRKPLLRCSSGVPGCLGCVVGGVCKGVSALSLRLLARFLSVPVVSLLFCGHFGPTSVPVVISQWCLGCVFAVCFGGFPVVLLVL